MSVTLDPRPFRAQESTRALGARLRGAQWIARFADSRPGDQHEPARIKHVNRSSPKPAVGKRAHGSGDARTVSKTGHHATDARKRAV